MTITLNSFHLIDRPLSNQTCEANKSPLESPLYAKSDILVGDLIESKEQVSKSNKNEPRREKTCIGGLPIKTDTNQATTIQKIARNLRFRNYKFEK